MPVFLPDIFSMIRKNRFDDGKENDMEDEVKKLPLKWELGEEQVAFQVDNYAMTGGIYVGLLCDNGEQECHLRRQSGMEELSEKY